KDDLTTEDGFRRSSLSQKGYFAAKGGVYPHRSKVRGTTPDGHGGPSVAEAMDGGKRPLVEVGVSRLDQGGMVPYVGGRNYFGGG
ncbi:MAG: hypothetical protein QMD16_02945, partial [Desulfitobacteriaceae bacterium]|nr:hypothetical protein [Desulfitobacteriaceae bacterium]MDI6878314.1 hypothetical protein [Desulfitobacteriaceae bacterium]